MHPKHAAGIRADSYGGRGGTTQQCEKPNHFAHTSSFLPKAASRVTTTAPKTAVNSTAWTGVQIRSGRPDTMALLHRSAHHKADCRH
jgi:hypothetical protein